MEELSLIIDSRDYKRMVGFDNHPIPGQFYITGPISGNPNPEKYFGYICQVRKKAGAFGTDIVLMRNVDGCLARHENQSYFLVSEEIKQKIIELLSEPIEDFENIEYTLGDEYPERGSVIEPQKDGPPVDNSQLMKITTTHSDGSKTIEVC